MPANVAARLMSEEVRTSDTFRPTPAKATLKSPTSDSGKTFELGPAIWEVLVKEHGSVKAAAHTMGDTDPSLLRRQIVDGTLPLKKLFEADPKALAAFGEFLVEHYGDAKKSRQEIAREKLPELFAAIIDAIVPEGK